MRPARTPIASAWARLSLAHKFLAAASVVVTCGMLLIGSWVAGRIETGVVHNSAAAAALYIDNAIKPHVQALAAAADMPEDDKKALDALMSPQAMSRPIVGFRIWQGDTIVYSDRRDLIGKTFHRTEARTRAWLGLVTGKLRRSSDKRHASPGSPVLEIYAPVRERGSHHIIALAETYEIATELEDELARAQVQSWLFVGAVTLAIIACLFGIVRNGSRTIAQQDLSLKRRIADLSRLLAENDELRRRVNQAHGRVVATNERFLRRIGADLHDGPVQLLGIALLKLDELADDVADGTVDAPDHAGEIEIIRGALIETMQEIRHISAGLAPPDIDKVSLAEVLQIIARKHEQRTGTKVRYEADGLAIDIPVPLKACLYRFVQEGLNNAYQHAEGKGQAVFATCDGDGVEVRVVDEGPGLTARAGLWGSDGDGQGLSGLRDRIESLGGVFEVRSTAGTGTSLTARFAVRREQAAARRHGRAAA